MRGRLQGKRSPSIFIMLRYGIISALLGFLPTAHAIAQCTKDTDCKGSRICESGSCITPKQVHQSSKTARPPTKATTPRHDVEEIDIGDLDNPAQIPSVVSAVLLDVASAEIQECTRIPMGRDYKNDPIKLFQSLTIRDKTGVIGYFLTGSCFMMGTGINQYTYWLFGRNKNGVYQFIEKAKDVGESINVALLRKRIREKLTSAPGAFMPNTAPNNAAPSFLARYTAPKSPKFAQMNAGIRQTQFLDKLADLLSKGIDVPGSVTLTLAECGNVNAFYTAQTRTVTLCFELWDYLQNGIPNSLNGIASAQEIANTVIGGVLFVYMHEIGHALIQTLNLPVLGREEDAADEISTFFTLKMGEETPYAIAGAMFFFKQRDLFYTRAHFSDEHSLGPQRQSNIACWAYGSNPSRFAYLLKGGLLTQSRAARCNAEYQKMEASIQQLLGTHLH
ncbi:MAG: DUF4344 domain-containing metallopeptidase [Burkholderiales bacterium]